MSPSVDPRIERTQTVVLSAAMEVVAERGFSGASIEAIAERSGVARSTIYRHWSERMDLLLEAVGSQLGDVGSVEAGDLRGHLIAMSSHLAGLLTSEPVGSVAASMILESRRDPLLDAMRRRFVAQRRLVAARLIADAVGRGELEATEDAEDLADDLAAPLFFRCLVLRAPVDDAWIERHVDRWLARFDAP